jgi:hypothetical protein
MPCHGLKTPFFFCSSFQEEIALIFVRLILSIVHRMIHIDLTPAMWNSRALSVVLLSKGMEILTKWLGFPSGMDG